MINGENDNIILFLFAAEGDRRDRGGFKVVDEWRRVVSAAVFRLARNVREFTWAFLSWAPSVQGTMRGECGFGGKHIDVALPDIEAGWINPENQTHEIHKIPD